MKPASVAAVIVFLLLTMATASAQTPIAFEHDCPDGEKPSTTKEGIVDKKQKKDEEGRKFHIYTTYCSSELTAGRDVKLTIRILTELKPGEPLLQIKEVPSVSKDDAGRVTFSQANPVPDDTTALSIQKYDYKVQISEAAEPRNYTIQTSLGYPDTIDKTRDPLVFALPVGVNSKGKLEIAKESQSGSFQAALFSTAKYTYDLKLRNFFRHYNTYVESITVDSDPPGWISRFTIKPGENEQWRIGPTGERIFSFDFNTAPLSGNLIHFGSAPPQLKFDIRYNDGNGRRLIYDEGKLPIAISSSGWVLFGAVLLGLAFGAGVRALLEWHFKEKVTRNRVIRVVLYSSVFGLVVVLLSIFGQLELKSKAFSFSSSYDNPLGMLTIGLVSAIAGLQIFTGWYNALKSE